MHSAVRSALVWKTRSDRRYRMSLDRQPIKKLLLPQQLFPCLLLGINNTYNILAISNYGHILHISNTLNLLDICNKMHL